jgi:rubrerythrin
MARASTTHHDGRHNSHDASKSHSRQMPKSHTNSRRQRGSSVNPEWLRDFLSEMLAVEMGGVKLYEKALNELEHTEHEDKLGQFLQQTERHVELCTEMLEAAGGDSDYQSPGAQAAEQKADGLLCAEVPPEMADLNNIENLVLAETKDHWNWETLASVVSKIGDAELKRMATKAISEVRKQEKTHLDWNEQTLSKLAMESAMRPPSEDMGESEAADDGTEEEEMAADREED